MAPRTLAQAIGLDDPVVEDAPAMAWAWRECADGCGTVFLGPAGRTRCLVCRTEAQVTRLGRGRDKDDEGGAEEMPRGVPLPLDREEVETLIAGGVRPAAVCAQFGLDAIQFSRWCRRQDVHYPGLPSPSAYDGLSALQVEIDHVRHAVQEPPEGPEECEEPDTPAAVPVSDVDVIRSITVDFPAPAADPPAQASTEDDPSDALDGLRDRLTQQRADLQARLAEVDRDLDALSRICVLLADSGA